MGNTSGKEEEHAAADNGGDHYSGNAPTNRVSSADLMVSSPPHGHIQSSAPLLFSSQEPLPPLHLNGVSSFNPFQRTDSRTYSNEPVEPGIPTIISWCLGGNNVTVEGSWDNWTTRKTLQRSGKDHSILLVLPSGVFRYRFIVDGEQRHIPDLPNETDDDGHPCNVLDVQGYVPESVESVVEFEAPSSPESSYGQVFPRDEDFTKDPLILPPQLETERETTPSKPQHVILNHLFTEKGRPADSVVALGLTHRFQSKYVTVVLYKPVKRQLI